MSAEKAGVTIIEYLRSGGIIGEECTVKVNEDMTVELRRRISGNPVTDVTDTLDPSVFEDLLHSFEKEDFFSFQDEYTSHDEVRDDITYSIKFSRQDRVKAITLEATGNPPQGLLTIRNKLEKLIEQLTAG